MSGESNIESCGKPSHMKRSTDDDSCSCNCARDCSKQPTCIRTSQNVENFEPSFVYQRKKHRKNSGFIWTAHPSSGSRPSDACQSSLSSVAPSMVRLEKKVSASELAIESVLSPDVVPIESNQDNAGYVNGFPDKEEASSEEALRSAMGSAVNVIYGNNCSSEKSNLNVGSVSLKIDRDDAGECSSRALSLGKVADDLEIDACISVLRGQGLIEKVFSRKRAYSKKGVSYKRSCSKACKVCKQSETAKNMLICDNCEDVFHANCCSPYTAIIQNSEWRCYSCIKKKHRMQMEKSSSNSVNVGAEIEWDGSDMLEGKFGAVAFMLRENEPHMSSVRIGREFQATIPDWSGPVDSGFYHLGAPLETKVSDNDYSLEGNSATPSNLSCIGNWLQCHEIIKGTGENADGTICGKWRRAPLLEVQTKAWECFDCIRWDPAHADCAIPQELGTEEIMKQLKYIEMLKPSLPSKKRKLNRSKGINSHRPSRRRRRQLKNSKAK